MDFFKSKLIEIQLPVWSIIKGYLPLSSYDEHSRLVCEYPKRKGKYLRPSFVSYSTQMYGGSQKDSLLTAAAVQISEEWLLIHDDFEDHSEERRSTKKELRPALNILCGDELAVNAGDSLHVTMWKILGEVARKFDDERGWKIYNKMVEVLLTAIQGQHLELSWTYNKENKTITEKKYLEMVLKKTAGYTIIGPIQLGAIIAKRDSKEEMKNIEEWGKPLGYAFQITDDLINLTIDNESQGKERGGDILEGKKTLMLIHLLKNCSKIEKVRIEKIYNKPRKNKTEKEKKYILKLMEKYGSLDYARDMAKKYAGLAEKKFEQCTDSLIESEAKKFFRQSFSFIVNRIR